MASCRSLSSPGVPGGGGAHGADAPPPLTSPEGEPRHGIRVYVGEAAPDRLMILPPVREAGGDDAAPSEAQEASLAGQSAPLVKTQGLTYGGVPIRMVDFTVGGSYVILPGIADFGFLQNGGYNLLTAAALECGANTQNAARVANGEAPALASVVAMPWNPVSDAWYIFAGKALDGATNAGTAKFSSCDDIVAHAEILLCTADKLLELTESVGVVVWNGVKYAPDGTFPEEVRQPWLIPPQASRDKFVARDLAINALAHLARLLLERPATTTATQTWATCAEGYAAALTAAKGLTDSLPLFGVASGSRPQAYFPPLETGTPVRAKPVATNTVVGIAAQRLQLIAHLARSGARTLKRLVESNVAGDLAGAYAEAGHSGDPVLGHELFWGFSDVQKGQPYNSMAHALRVLFGRWEFTGLQEPAASFWKAPGLRPYTDPRCGGYSALTAVQDGALGTATRNEQSKAAPFARLADPTSSRSADLIERLGLVVPNLADTEPNALRAAVIQLAQKSLYRSIGGTLSEAAFNSTDAVPLQPGGALSLALQARPTSDFRRALERNRTTFELLTGFNTEHKDLYGVKVVGGVNVDSTTLAGVKAVTIENGLDRGALVEDVLAHLAPLQTNAQCPVNLFDPTRTAAKEAAFQDAFRLGQTFSNLLATIQRGAATKEPDPGAPIAALASAGIAEIAPWAGPGTVGILAYAPTNQSETELVWLTLTGVRPEDLGVATPEALGAAIGLHYGEPWEADCLAGRRKACEGAPAALAKPSQKPTVSGSGRELSVTIKYQLPLARFRETTARKRFLYVIADPTLSKGGVLGAAPSAGPSPWFAINTVVTVSDLQRRLANNVFGLSYDGDASAGDIERYCVPGMEKNAFVPLENELTTDGDATEDSWQHYLTLARAAAFRADELGKELVELGTTRDLRNEQAREELGTRCGVAAGGADISFANGEATGSTTNPELAQCLDEPTYDLVFLTRPPNLGAEGSLAQVAAISEAMRCGEAQGSQTDPGLCAKLKAYKDAGCGTASTSAICVGNRVSVAGLSEAPHPSEAGNAYSGYEPKDWNCSLPLRMLESGDWHELPLAAQQPYARPEEISDLLASLRLDVHGLPVRQRAKPSDPKTLEDAGSPADWTLLVDGAPVLDSSSGLYMDGETPGPAPWPGCVLDDTSGKGNDHRCHSTGTPVLAWAKDLESIFPHSRPTATNADQVRVEVRRQLEGALWAMGAMAGKIPAGTFSVPVPAAINSAKNAQGQNVQESLDPAAAPTVYAGGAFMNSTSLRDPRAFELLPEVGREAPGSAMNRVTEADRARLGTGWRLPASVASAELSANSGYAGTELPAWLRRVYSNSGDYLWVRAQSPERLFPENDGIRGVFSAWLAAAVKSEDWATGRHTYLANFKYPVGSLGRSCWVGPQGAEVPVFEYFWAAEALGDWEGKPYIPQDGAGSGPGNYNDGRFAMTDPNINRPARSGTVLRDLFQYSHPEWSIPSVSPWNQTVASYFPEHASSDVGYLRPTYRIAFGYHDEYGSYNAENGWGGWDFAAKAPVQGWLTCYHQFGTHAGIVDEEQAVPEIRSVCRHDYGWSDGTDGFYQQVTSFVTRPTICSPDERIDYFINAHYIPRDRDATLREVAQALALSCVVGKNSLPMRAAISRVGEPPAINEPRDLAKLELWVEGERQKVEAFAGGLVLRNVPKRAVADYRAGTNASGTLKGSHGQLIIEQGKSLSEIAIGVQTAHDHLRGLRDLVSQTRRVLRSDVLSTNRALLSLELSRIQLEAAAMKAIATETAAFAQAAVRAVGSWKVWALDENTTATIGFLLTANNSEIDRRAARDSLDMVDKQQQLVLDEAAHGLDTALADLDTNIRNTISALAKQLEGLRLAVLTAQGTAAKLQDSQAEARHYAAKAAGVDYYRDEQGNVVETFPLNTALRRQYDAYQLRYQEALTHAKRLAYMARLAIEQRLGVRLGELHEPIGALEAPALWVDDVCSLTGIDYGSLSTFEVSNASGAAGNGGTEDEALKDQEAIQAFADGFIGDYVENLALFVEYYNAQYPSQDSEDLVAISLRDDVLAAEGQCLRQSRNLLYFSDDLRGSMRVAGDEGILGWTTTGCSADRCLVVHDGGGVLGAGSAVQSPPLGLGGVTWLQERDVSDLVAGKDGVSVQGTDDGKLGVSTYEWDGELPRPGVAQRVNLEEGGYVLSWWDMARSIDENEPATTAGATYRVWVLGPDDDVVAMGSYSPPSDGDWSERRLLDVEAGRSGVYTLVLQASDEPDRLGSVAIANLQLEQEGAARGASAYERTSASREVVAVGCVGGSPADFQQAFDYRCEGGECFYELAVPFVVDTVQLSRGESPLMGKIARGNYNYRHEALAVNAVGYGLLDCGRDARASCGANAYLEYDLDHRASRVAVLSAHDQQEFDFGSGVIHHGKALAAERYLSIPLGATDQSLIEQPSFRKRELVGRPLDGAYRLRIYDSPSLRWDRLEDVQLLLHYRYWSPVSRINEN